LRHVKAVHSVEYPLSNHGDLYLATGGGFSIGVAHLPELAARHRQIDARLGEHPPRGGAAAPTPDDRPRQPVGYAPHVGTELLRHLRFVFTLFTLPVSGSWVWLVSTRTDYLIEGDRISTATGIVYRRRSSVRFDRIDHLETGRNFAHGPFGTADVEVYTVGSMACDLTLRAIAQHDVAMEHIRRRTEMR
jgi:membrane protein YdbS with pleckstrin-like domain